jgi:hypothetical protein
MSLAGFARLPGEYVRHQLDRLAALMFIKSGARKNADRR